MNLERMNVILNDDEKFDIFYDERAVWVQGINETAQIAKVGFVDNFEEKDVFIKDLYENDFGDGGKNYFSEIYNQ